MTSTAEKQTRVLVIDQDPAVHVEIGRILAPALAAPRLNDVESELLGEVARVDSAHGSTSFLVDFVLQGREGLQKVRQSRQQGSPYALAFLAAYPPSGWNGVQTVQKLWGEDPDLQIVICRVNSDPSWQDIANQLRGFDRLLILEKPLGTAEVIQTAVNLASKWVLQRQVNNRQELLSVHATERSCEHEKSTPVVQAQLERVAPTESEWTHATRMASIGQLAAGVAHEINTPTQFVSDNLSFLEDAFGDFRRLLKAHVSLLTDLPSSSGKESVLALQEEVELDYLLKEVPRAIAQSREGMRRVGETVGSMKHFCDPTGNELRQVDLNATLNATLIAARNEWKYVAELQAKLDQDLPTISAKPAALNQVFLNLVINAANAMGFHAEKGTKGTLGVQTTQVDGRTVQVRISDTGTGIPVEFGRKVFDPLFTTKIETESPITGQGLPEAHSVVVTQHGGNIYFESEPGAGTTFVVNLPIQQPEAA